jgi:hypothetical protein
MDNTGACVLNGNCPQTTHLRHANKLVRRVRQCATRCQSNAEAITLEECPNDKAETLKLYPNLY